MHGHIVSNEIETQIHQGKGCIIFDFGMYFPYHLISGEELVFRLSLGEEPLTDVKLNHRYPNKDYYTITKKYDSRRLSKVGYPYFIDLGDDPFLAILCVTLGIKCKGREKATDCLFPLSVQLTKERPVCALSMRLVHESGEITFTSYEYNEKGWKPYCWTSNRDEAESESLRWLSSVPIESEKPTIVFDTAITPIPQKLNELLIL